jgi:hypothetical protein
VATEEDDRGGEELGAGKFDLDVGHDDTGGELEGGGEFLKGRLGLKRSQEEEMRGRRTGRGTGTKGGKARSIRNQNSRRKI